MKVKLYAETMQKFVVKKISRSTNITIASEEQCGSQCGGEVKKTDDLELSTSVKMSGYLKKKRNRVGGWVKMYFVLQNSLLMSYNSIEEYEKKLVSFKDVICLIPGSSVLLPSLEPRFTIASNLNTFYTFRCEDNKICSKWITAILECLSRDIDYKTSTTTSSSPTKAFHSQQNLTHKSNTKCHTSHRSWENLNHNQVVPDSNWIVNHNGRILLELNYMNSNRAKLPIAHNTAKILQNCTDNDVITTKKKVNFIQHDENQNCIRNTEHEHENADQCIFRLHQDTEQKKQSKDADRLKMLFPGCESQRPPEISAASGGNDGNDYSQIGIEEQSQTMSFGYEDYSVVNYQSFDSKKFNHKLNIDTFEDDTYAEIGCKRDDATLKNLQDDAKLQRERNEPVYASVDKEKKEKARLNKLIKLDEGNRIDKIYEDIVEVDKTSNDEGNIYELIDIPLRPSKKSRSLVFKNWSRIHLFDFAKRFKETPEEITKAASTETINKRQKASLTLSDFSKRFNYLSMRNKVKKPNIKNISMASTSSESNSSTMPAQLKNDRKNSNSTSVLSLNENT